MARGKPRRYSFQQYLDEADNKPFILETGAGGVAAKEIVIQPPDGNTMLDIADNQTNPRLVLELLGGDQADALLELLGKAPASVMNNVMQDAMAHFGLAAARQGDSGAPSS